MSTSPTATAHFPDMLVAMRMVRDDEARWSGARSWFGGLPAIDPARWPRSPNTGLPLHHIAHVDLAEIPRGANTPPLPRTGTLSFFADTELEPLAVAVVFTEPPARPPAPLPADCPPLGGGHWRRYSKGAATKAEAPRVYRRWPIDFTLMRSIGRNYAPAPDLEAKRGPKPESIHVFDHTRLAHFSIGLFPWEAIRRLVQDYRGVIAQHREWLAGDTRKLESLRGDTAPGNEKRLSEMEKRVAAGLEKDRTLDAARQFIARWSSLAESHKPYDAIGLEIAEAVEADTLRILRLGIHSRHGGGTTPLKDAASNVYRDMFVGPPDVLAKIPAAVRDYFLNSRRVSGWNGRLHQMLGVTGRLYDEPDYLAHDVSLLVVQSDDMMSWLWGGDCEQLGFWISLEDLAARRWGKVRGSVGQG